MLAVVVPAALLFISGYFFVKGVEHNRIVHIGTMRLDELRRRTVYHLGLEKAGFEKQAQFFAINSGVVSLLDGRAEGVAAARLDTLRKEYELQTIALVDSQGQICSFSGVSPEPVMNRFPEDMNELLSHAESTRFAVSQRGVVLQAVVPVERGEHVLGAVIITRLFELNLGFESTLLLFDQRIQSQGKYTHFMHPFVRSMSFSGTETPLVLMNGSIILGTIPLPGIQPERAQLLVGINQRELVAHYRVILRDGVKIVWMLMLLFLLLGLLLSRRLMHPMYQLNEAARRAVNEAAMVDWPPMSHDEFGVMNSSLREITAQVHNLLRQRDDACAEAERARNAKVDFLANISHELRTPLNGIIGMTESLIDTSLKESQKECIRNIRMSSDQLVMVIGDIFDASHIEANTLQLTRAKFDLNEMLEDFVSLTRLKAKQKRVAVEYHISSKTPQCVIGDRTRIRQILANLVNNAIKFTSQGCIQIHVHSHNLYQGMEEFVFTVKDTGIGMEQWKVQSLFRAFEQADSSSTRRFGGLGLGLTITSKITEKMSGKIAVLSTLGKGSSFSVILPLAIPESVVVNTTKSEFGVWKRSPKVLVAEDNKMNQIVIRRVLEKIGCQVVMAVNGVEALLCFGENECDLVLMDCQMPEMDGFEATRKIHEKNSEMLVVALTAHALEADRQLCLDAGMIDHITKPINEACVLEMLKRHLAHLIA